MILGCENIAPGIGLTGSWVDNCLMRSDGDQDNASFQGSLTHLTDTGQLSLGQVAAPCSLLELWDDDAHPILSITAAHATDYDPQAQFCTGVTDTVKCSMGVDSGDSYKFKIYMGSGIGDTSQFVMDSSGRIGIGVAPSGTAQLKLNGALDMNANSIENLMSWPDAGAHYNVKAYGATGDGITDDQSAIQTAINAVNTVGGGILFFPKGEYFIGSALSMASNVFLEGTGESSIINVGGNYKGLVFTGTLGAEIVNTGVRKIKIVGTGNVAHTSNTLISMTAYVENSIITECWLIDAGYDAWHALKDCSHIFITDNYIINPQDDGLNPGGDNSGTGTAYITIQGNHVDSAGGDGIHISDSSNHISIIGNVIINSGCGIGIYNSSYNIINSNIIENCGTGIETKSGTCAYLDIHDNSINTTTSIGIYLNNHGSDYCNITGNILIDINSGSSHGIYSKNTDYTTISDNTVKNADYGICMEGGNYCTVTGNNTSGANRGISVYINNSNISNNNTDTLLDYGIVVSGGAGYADNIISGNTISNVTNTDGINIYCNASLVSNNIVRSVGGDCIKDTLGTNRIFLNDIDGTMTYHANDSILHMNSSKQLGIGTYTPGNTVEISNTGPTQLRLHDSGSANYYADIGCNFADECFSMSVYNTKFFATRGYTTPDELIFLLGGNEVFRIFNNQLFLDSATPNGTFHCTTESDAADSGMCKLLFKREQSGGEETTHAAIYAAHDGASDDQKGYIVLCTNDGTDGDSPTEAMRIDTLGNVGIGTSPDSDYRLHVSGRGIYVQNTLTDPSATTNINFFSPTLKNTANNANTVRGINLTAIYSGASTGDHTGTFRSMSMSAYNSSTQTVNYFDGINASIGLLANGVITNASPIKANFYSTNGTITNGKNIWIASPSGGTITNLYGLYIENMSAGTTLNYAIYSAGGQSYFAGNIGINDTAPAEKLDVNGNTNVTGVYKVADTQVVGAQQAHIADAGVGTEIATINAILAAMETHGLLASA